MGVLKNEHEISIIRMAVWDDDLMIDNYVINSIEV